MKIFSGILLVIGLVIVADYFALLGTKNKKVLDFSELRIKTVDANTKRPIFNTRAVCYRHRDHDICTIKDSGELDIVSAQFPVHKVLTNTWLFQKSEEYIMPSDPNIKIMLIHNDYQKTSDDYDMHDIHTNSGQEIIVEMQPQNRGDAEENNNE